MDSFPHSMSEDTAVWIDGVILWRWLDSTTDSMDMNSGELQGMVRDREAGMLQSMGSQSVGHDLATTLNNFVV